MDFQNKSNDHKQRFSLQPIHTPDRISFENKIYTKRNTIDIYTVNTVLPKDVVPKRSGLKKMTTDMTAYERSNRSIFRGELVDSKEIFKTQYLLPNINKLPRFFIEIKADIEESLKRCKEDISENKDAKIKKVKNDLTVKYSTGIYNH